jgi:hypothetical protein
MSSSKESTTMNVEPRDSSATPLGDDEHNDFFKLGDEGRYEGGPAHVEQEAQEMAALAKELDRSSPRTLRTPDQEAKRIRFALIVGMVIGFCAATVLFASVLALRRDPEGVPPDARTLPPAAPVQAAFAAELLPAQRAPTPPPTSTESPVEQAIPPAEANAISPPIEASRSKAPKPTGARPRALLPNQVHHPVPQTPPTHEQAATPPPIKPAEQPATASFPAQ